MAIKKGDLVNVTDLKKTGLVITDTYCTVFTTKDLNNLSYIDKELHSRTLLSSEVLVVDLLIEGTIYKKVPISTLHRVR